MTLRRRPWSLRWTAVGTPTTRTARQTLTLLAFPLGSGDAYTKTWGRAPQLSCVGRKCFLLGGSPHSHPFPRISSVSVEQAVRRKTMCLQQAKFFGYVGSNAGVRVEAEETSAESMFPTLTDKKAVGSSWVFAPTAEVLFGRFPALRPN